MSQAAAAPPKAGGNPSLRLNLSQASQAAAAAAPSNEKKPAPASLAPPAAKKRRFSPVNIAPHEAKAASVSVLHQKTTLSLVLQHPVASDPTWYAAGKSTLYVIDNGGTVAAGKVRHLAVHLRGSCQVTDIAVECLVGDALKPDKKLKSTFQHFDPLEHVLIKPAVSYTAEDASDPTEYDFDADAQSSRGAAGMTTALRAASIASNMGELRLTVEPCSSGPEKIETAFEAWKQELAFTNDATADGRVVQELREKLQERSTGRRNARIELVAKRLAEASCSKEKGNRAFKITIRYKIPLNKPIVHLGGLHALTTSLTPHIYTTVGVVGDHEGPRCWIPCLDSASVGHRATHELTVQVTAPMRHGISCVGLGEDFGCSDARLHDATWNVEMAREELGADHFEMIQLLAQQARGRTTGAHIIPPELSSKTVSIDAIRATAVWCSCSWTPVPARSMGFAVGPFKVLEDSEYFGPTAVAGDDDDEDDDGNSLSLEERHQAFVDSAHEKGEGIRQVYFAPIFERKHIFAEADSRLLPNTVIRLLSVNAQQSETSNGLEKAMHYSTVGVPHRALSLMRDVLALPSYRTSSYTQVWIPNAVHGGLSSGALHNCPEVLVNCFLGGAIMDSRLLPPIGSRLPYYQGGRVLQLMQARCAIRGWISATLPLGGGDDVGSGYILTLIEAFIMSMYERGHGAHGEGKVR